MDQQKMWLAIRILMILILISKCNMQRNNDIKDYWYGHDTKPDPPLSPAFDNFLTHEPSRSNPINPGDFCTGIQCQLSGFNDEQKGKLCTSFNGYREEFVYGRTTWKTGRQNRLSDSFSNIFYAAWDEEIAEYAQQKAALCVPEVLFKNYAHKGPLQPHWNIDPKRYPSNSECSVFVMVNEYTKVKFHEVREQIPHYFPVVVIYRRGDGLFLYRPITSYGFGCGIVVRKNETHYTEHMVCYYCPAVNINHFTEYLPRNGTPCSNCEGYFGLTDIQCTTDKDPKQAKFLGKNWIGLCFTEVIPFQKFISTTYSPENCSYSNTTTTPTTRATTRATTRETTRETTRATTIDTLSTAKHHDSYSKTAVLRCLMYVHLFTTSLTLIGFMSIYFYSKYFFRVGFNKKEEIAEDVDK